MEVSLNTVVHFYINGITEHVYFGMFSFFTIMLVRLIYLVYVDLLHLFPLLLHVPLYNYTSYLFTLFTTVDVYLGSFQYVVMCNDAVYKIEPNIP